MVLELRSAPADVPIRVLVCDDHALVTDGIAFALERETDLALVGSATGDPRSAVALAARERPDVVVMDLHFDGEMDGLYATREIVDHDPTAKVVIISGYGSDAAVIESIEAGAVGFVSKSLGLRELCHAIRTVASGETVFPATVPMLLRRVSRERAAVLEARGRLRRLTPREYEILLLIAEGLGNDDIAARLFISHRTVETHVHNLLRKLGVTSKLQAAVFAVKHGAVAV